MSKLWVLWASEKEHFDKQDEDVSRGSRRGQNAKVGIDGIHLVRISLNGAGRQSPSWAEEGLGGEREQVPRQRAAVGFLRRYYLSAAANLRRYRYLHLFFSFRKRNMVIKKIMIVDTLVFHDVPGTGPSLSIFAHFS